MIQTYGIDVQNGDVEIPSLLCIFKLRGAVPFRGAVVRIDRPPDNIRLQVVQPGDKVPLDGVVESGNASLNTSALTGESLPRDVKEGDEIISGCINLNGVLKIRTTKEFGESTVSKILDLDESASSRKSRSEAFISRFAKIYTPAVCISAVLLGIAVPLLRMAFGMDAAWVDWIYRALTFLVVSCPCALVISIPLSFFAGIGGALLAMYQTSVQAAIFKSAMTYEILLIVVIGGIGSITGSVLTSFLYIASLEWLLRGLDSGEFLGIQAPGLFKNGFRMAVVSVIIMCVVLFFRKGLMGDRELSDLLKRKKKASKGGKVNG